MNGIARAWKGICTTTLVVSFVLAMFTNTAHADVTQVPWSGLGSENLPCVAGAHWTLTPGFGITAATIGVGTHAWTMLQAWDDQESWYIDTGPVATVPGVALAYLGSGDERNQLILANCVGQPDTPSPPLPLPPPPPTTEPGPSTPSPSPSPSPTPTPTVTQHRAVVICDHWTRHAAKHIRLVRFRAHGVSVYKCV